jgi:hypothetical protein
MASSKGLQYDPVMTHESSYLKYHTNMGSVHTSYLEVVKKHHSSLPKGVCLITVSNLEGQDRF